MTTIAFFTVINKYIYGLHLFWDNAHKNDLVGWLATCWNEVFLSNRPGSRPGSNDKEGVLHIPKISRIEVSLVSYVGYPFFWLGVKPSLPRGYSQCTLIPANWTDPSWLYIGKNKFVNKKNIEQAQC